MVPQKRYVSPPSPGHGGSHLQGSDNTDVTHPNPATEKGFSVGTNREGAEEEGQVRFDGNVGHCDLEPW